MNNICKKVDKLLMDYIDGELNEKDNLFVKSHLDNCKACLEQYNSLKLLINEVSQITMQEPPVDFAAKLHNRLVNESTNKEKYKFVFDIKPYAGMAVSAALIALVALGAHFYTDYSDNLDSDYIKQSQQMSVPNILENSNQEDTFVENKTVVENNNTVDKGLTNKNVNVEVNKAADSKQADLIDDTKSNAYDATSESEVSADFDSVSAVSQQSEQDNDAVASDITQDTYSNDVDKTLDNDTISYGVSKDSRSIKSNGMKTQALTSESANEYENSSEITEYSEYFVDLSENIEIFEKIQHDYSGTFEDDFFIVKTNTDEFDKLYEMLSKDFVTVSCIGKCEEQNIIRIKYK